MNESCLLAIVLCVLNSLFLAEEDWSGEYRGRNHEKGELEDDSIH